MENKDLIDKVQEYLNAVKALKNVPTWFTSEEASLYLNVSVSTFYRLAKNIRMAVIRKGRRKLYNKSGIEQIKLKMKYNAYIKEFQKRLNTGKFE